MYPLQQTSHICLWQYTSQTNTVQFACNIYNVRIYDTSADQYTYMFLTDSGSQNISVEGYCFLEVWNSNCNMV